MKYFELNSLRVFFGYPLFYLFFIILSDLPKNIYLFSPLGWVKVFTLLWYVLVCGMYIMWLNQFKSLKWFIIRGCSMVVGVRSCCALLHTLCNLKATQMNVQCSITWKIILYKFELSHNGSRSKQKTFVVQKMKAQLIIEILLRLHFESIRWPWHLTVPHSLLPSQPWQKH